MLLTNNKVLWLVNFQSFNTMRPFKNYVTFLGNHYYPTSFPTDDFLTYMTRRHLIGRSGKQRHTDTLKDKDANRGTHRLKDTQTDSKIHRQAIRHTETREHTLSLEETHSFSPSFSDFSIIRFFLNRFINLISLYIFRKPNYSSTRLN